MKEKDYVVFYGKIGTAGSVKAKEFETEEECMKEANDGCGWFIQTRQ